MAGSDGGALGVFVFLTKREGKERGRRQEEEGDGARVSLRLGCGIKGEGEVVERGGGAHGMGDHGAHAPCVTRKPTTKGMPFSSKG
jgi:hypothetical protein